MNTIVDYIKDFFALLPTIQIMDIIDILLVALVIYGIIIMIQTTGAARIAKSVIIILLLTVVTEILDMHLMNFLLDKILEIGLIALVIMFQPELRRMLEKLGSKTFREILNMKTEQGETEKVIAQTVAACEVLSKERTGALIVFERSVSLIDHQKSGTVIDAQVTSELLRNIFFTKAALHDGAVLIRKDRLAAAGCVLPLTQNRNISSDLGTRHRAAIGMSEATDAVVVIVSEETGTISVAVGGMLKRHLAAQTLEKLLQNELMPATEDKPRNPLKRLKLPNNKKAKDDTDAET
ncbi:MAG: diadenylate cyclase CdaA [Oscillospiraceae bacterium]|nr:diadenylate cyclase CdaA [Oscillospiraceae bacterium]